MAACQEDQSKQSKCHYSHTHGGVFIQRQIHDWHQRTFQISGIIVRFTPDMTGVKKTTHCSNGSTSCNGNHQGHSIVIGGWKKYKVALCQLFVYSFVVSYRWIPHARMARQWLSRNPSGLAALMSRTGTGSDGPTLGPCCRHWLLVQMLRVPQILPLPMPPCWSVENKPAITREKNLIKMNFPVIGLH